MKRYILTLIVILSSVLSGKAQEARFTRAQVDSIIELAAASYEAPSIDCVRLEGTVEEVAAKLKEHGWRNPFARFPEEELAKAGFPRETRHLNGVLLEGIFMRRKANLVLYPVSVENRNIAYAAISFTVRGDRLDRFVEKSVMPVVHRYARKYGEYRITDIDRRYEQAGSKTTGQEYGCNRHIISFEFEDPQILLRAQTDRDCRFNIVIQYINKINLARQLLDSPYDYHYCPNPPPPPPRHRHHRR